MWHTFVEKVYVLFVTFSICEEQKGESSFLCVEIETARTALWKRMNGQFVV